MLQKLTALQTRRSTRIIESGRTLNYTDTGFAVGPSSVSTGPEFAFGKWWWAEVVNNFTSNPELRIMSSTTGDSWTTHSTLLNYSAPFGKLGYIAHKRFIFSDGYCLVIGRYADFQSGTYSNHRGFVGITNDGINWNLYDNLTFVPADSVTNSYTFGNGILYAQNSGLAYQFATLASNFTDWQNISGSIANGSNQFSIQFLAGNFYICSTATGNHNFYVSADLLTSSLVSTFPYFSGRTFLTNSLSAVKVNNLDMLWTITEEGTPKTYYFWKSFNGSYWEGSSLPASFYQNQTQPNWSATFGSFGNRFGGGGGYVAIYYSTLWSVGFGNGVVTGTLASSNFLNFGEFANALNISVYPSCCGPSFLSRRQGTTEYLISP